MDHFDRLDHSDLCHFVLHHSCARTGRHAGVEAFGHQFMRDARRRDYSGTGEGIYLSGVAACQRSGRLGAGRRGMAGNFSAYYLGFSMMILMAIAYIMSTLGLGTMGTGSVVMLAPAVFAFGLVAFGFLGMGPVTIAVDSYGPVTDNAQ